MATKISSCLKVYFIGFYIYLIDIYYLYNPFSKYYTPL